MSTIFSPLGRPLQLTPLPPLLAFFRKSSFIEAIEPFSPKKISTSHSSSERSWELSKADPRLLIKNKLLTHVGEL
ncbi:hypothetical protein MHLP_04580 [Candidatus Mycoplasma haematolamae str. Purdue]|uniref:Uncharacterized protein n=1 Tax=Mycoplasma haematolamae (strain Purdue) TaxID=1212765 RepID=I7CH53_MYCHA|nr:hypothetical protein MHLP_04580 [Candidatus Mycoplasma haematolamae str. Purdue]